MYFALHPPPPPTPTPPHTPPQPLPPPPTGKDLHNDWLSSALPVYHVRPTPYTRTISTPPFLINYSGAIFRTFPGKWQALLEVSPRTFDPKP